MYHDVFHEKTFERRLAGNFGARIMLAFGGLGSRYGIPADFLAMLFWGFIMLIVTSVAFALSGNINVGIMVGLPLLFIGSYLGVIPLTLIALLAFIISAWLLHSLVLRQT